MAELQPDPDSPEARIAAQMIMLRGRYLEAMAEQITVLQQALSACERNDLPPDLRAALRMVSHKLAGTGKTYGFPEVSVAGRTLTDVMAGDPGIDPRSLTGMTRTLLTACNDAQGSQDTTVRQEPPAEIRPQALAPQPVYAPARTGFGRRNADPAPVSAPAPVYRQPMTTRRPLILVADDDETVRSLFGQLFAEEARVVFATNADEALAMMQRFPPDIVLLDDIMPGAITGLKLLENLKSSRDLAHIPVLMITASDGDEHIDRGLRAGAAGYITKPFDAVNVVNRVRKILG